MPATMPRLTASLASALAPVTERQLALFRRRAGQRDDLADMLGRERRRRLRAQRILQPRCGRGLRRSGRPAAAPTPHRLWPDAEPTRDVAHFNPAAERRIISFRQLARRLVGPGEPLQVPRCSDVRVIGTADRGGMNRLGRTMAKRRAPLCHLPDGPESHKNAAAHRSRPMVSDCGRPDSPPQLARSRRFWRRVLRRGFRLWYRLDVSRYN